MPSKVLEKVAVVIGDTFCFCDKEFSKTCSVRALKNLDCKESIIRITPIIRDDRTKPQENCDGQPFDGFLGTLDHVGRFKK